MSIYYLRNISNNLILEDKNFETLDEALNSAKVLTKKNPKLKIEILKCMGMITYIETITGEHEEIFFN